MSYECGQWVVHSVRVKLRHAGAQRQMRRNQRGEKKRGIIVHQQHVHNITHLVSAQFFFLIVLELQYSTPAFLQNPPEIVKGPLRCPSFELAETNMQQNVAFRFFSLAFENMYLYLKAKLSFHIISGGKILLSDMISSVQTTRISNRRCGCQCSCTKQMPEILKTANSFSENSLKGLYKSKATFFLHETIF